MTYTYSPCGVCSKSIEIDIDGEIIKDLRIIGGCHGNLQGISALCRGRKASDVILSLKGIKCGNKATSCPDQIAQALMQATK